MLVVGWRDISLPIPYRFDSSIQMIDMIIQGLDLSDHVPILLGFFEAWTGTAIWSIDAIQRQITAPLARTLAVAFDLTSFALVTVSV